MSSLTTHTGLKRSSVKSSDEQPKLKLTKEEQEILDGKMGPLLQKALKTIVAYGELFRATELVDLHLADPKALGVHCEQRSSGRVDHETQDIRKSVAHA